MQAVLEFWSFGVLERNGSTFFSVVQCGEAFHGLGIQDVRGFDADLLVGRTEKKERNGWVAFPLIKKITWHSRQLYCCSIKI
jgi:hypothetical protein